MIKAPDRLPFLNAIVWQGVGLCGNNLYTRFTEVQVLRRHEKEWALRDAAGGIGEEELKFVRELVHPVKRSVTYSGFGALVSPFRGCLERI